MTKLSYISAPTETPDTRNEAFYQEISHSWEERAKNLRERRWEELKLRENL
jgi:hypothetical protein